METSPSPEKKPSAALLELGFRQNGTRDPEQTPKTYNTIDSFGKLYIVAYDEEGNEWNIKGVDRDDMERLLAEAGFTHATLD